MVLLRTGVGPAVQKLANCGALQVPCPNCRLLVRSHQAPAPSSRLCVHPARTRSTGASSDAHHNPTQGRSPSAHVQQAFLQTANDCTPPFHIRALLRAVYTQRHLTTTAHPRQRPRSPPPCTPRRTHARLLTSTRKKNGGRYKHAMKCNVISHYAVTVCAKTVHRYQDQPLTNTWFQAYITQWLL